MRISIHTLGTRGDVQPYLALAVELARRGHDVQMAAPAQFEAFVTRRAIRFVPLPAQFLALLDSPEGKAAIAGGQGFSAGFKLIKHVKPLMQRLLDEEWQAARAFSPELIVYHPKSVASLHIAQRLGIPAILASPLPGFTPTTAFPSPLLPFRSLGPLNKASHLLSIHGADLLFGKLIGKWRQDTLGLDGRRTHCRQVGTIYAYSPNVLPKPADWDSSILVSGYWFLDDEEHWQPPGELSKFLDQGEQPIYVGFGSMPGLDPGVLGRTVIEALAMAGKRGLLATGGGALEVAQVPDHVHVIASAPHDQLFKRVSAALHHGGAGTTGASLRAGLPTIICPFFGDQPFWGRRIAQLGAGPAPIDRKRLDVETLAAAFRAAANADTKRRAAVIGEQISAERGVHNAAEFIELAASNLIRPSAAVR